MSNKRAAAIKAPLVGIVRQALGRELSRCFPIQYPGSLAMLAAIRRFSGIKG
jgi:hypothetical protein